MFNRLRQLYADIKAYGKMQEEEREMVSWLAFQDTSTWMLLMRLSQLEEQELKDLWTLTSNASCIQEEGPQAREKRIAAETKLLQRLAARHGMQLVSTSRLAVLEENWKKVKQAKKDKKNESKGKN